MKITCTKRSRDEIIRDRDEYDAKRKSIHEQADKERTNFRRALNDVYENVKSQLESELANFDTLNLRINVSSGIRDTLEVTVGSNQDDVHSKHKALSWDYRASLTEEGEVLRQSGSWSGLQAVTEEQLESLRQSVACLEVLNSIDWAVILATPTPKYDDYLITDSYSIDRDRPDYESELLEAEIDEAIQNGSWIKGHGYKYYLSRATVYYKILKETPTQYEVMEVWEDNLKKGETNIHPYRIKKDTFFQVIDQPIETYNE